MIEPAANGLEDSLGKLFFIPPLFNRLRHSGNENALVAPTAQLVPTTKEKDGPRRAEDSALRCLPRFFVITRRRYQEDKIVSRVSHVNWLKGFASRCA